MPQTDNEIICRPFSGIISQERATGYLKRVMMGDKIPHAYLFTGIEGIGKTTTAIALAQALNCLQPRDFEGCGDCIPCRRIRNRNFADLIFIEPDGHNIKIEQIRDLNRALSFKPVSGKYRVVIVNHAERMTAEAANSFLKSLEEPPPHNVIIIKVVEPLDLLPTIISRCQIVPFRPLPASKIRDWLKTEMGLDEEKAALLSRISEGSLGKAIQFKENDILEYRQNCLIELMRLPELPMEQVLQTAWDYSERSKKRNSDSAELKDNGLFELLGMWKTWYRDLILVKVRGPRDKIINIDFSRKLKNISENFRLDNLLESFQVIDRAQREMMRNPNPGLMMENIMIALKRFSEIPASLPAFVPKTPGEI
ncbi:MAG: DNA polymerase III subunit delta' [Deltaproteobacteria bacterium]|nr:DNA polymerase III subunit delta' [Deltaproteobacteria bacterium]